MKKTDQEDERREEKDKENRSPGKLEKVDHWIAALTAIPVLGIILKTALNKLGEKGAEKLAEKLGDVMGLNFLSAEKSVSDEILYAAALYSPEAGLSTDEREKIDAFEASLRKSDAKKCEAYVLFVAKMVSQLKKESGGNQGKNGGTPSKPSVDFSKGFVAAGFFLKELVKRATDEEKIAFLKGKNVFSLIQKRKPSFADKAKKTIKKEEEKNRKDFNQTMSKFRNWAETL